MNLKNLWIPVATLVLAAGYGARQEAQESALEARVIALEQRVAQVEGYLQKQAGAAAELSASLDASEEAGFTFGINPESRKILLRAWRERAATVGKNVPGSEAKEEGGGEGERQAGG